MQTQILYESCSSASKINAEPTIECENVQCSVKLMDEVDSRMGRHPLRGGFE
jgi:hypothetical protein